MHNYVYLRIEASFWFLQKFGSWGKKSYIVLSFDLNLQDDQEKTDTTPSTQLEKSKKKDQQTKGKKDEEKEKQGPK